jgi:hypothetical protein
MATSKYGASPHADRQRTSIIDKDANNLGCEARPGSHIPLPINAEWRSRCCAPVYASYLNCTSLATERALTTPATVLFLEFHSAERVWET